MIANRFIIDARAAGSWISDNLLFITILAASFLISYSSAGMRSYWFDELLSVYTYGTSKPTVGEAIYELADKSIHPPLYQAILWYWMTLFGSAEADTRLLSNIYIVLATVCLYFIAKRMMGKKQALVAIVVFVLMASTLRYALEARSYAQTIFLATASSLIVLHLASLWRSGENLLGRRAVAISALLAVVNTALVLTHYYNLFFMVAQGAYLFFVAVLAANERGYLRMGATLITTTLLPLVLFLLLWGDVLHDSFATFTSDGGYQVRNLPSATPIEMVTGMVLFTNVEYPGTLLVAFAVAAFAVVFRDRKDGPDVLFLLIWLVGPCLLAWFVFASVGHERYSRRYFLFSTPAIPLMLTYLADRLARQYAAAVVLLIAVAIVVPRGLLVLVKDDRNLARIADDVVRYIDGDPDRKASYVVYETGKIAVMNHYLGRFPKARSIGTLSTDGKTIPEVDVTQTLLVVFGHFGVDREKGALLKALKQKYIVEHYLLHGRSGFVAFRREKD